MVFLDKCCIPQNDPVAKAYGISMLADYLRASKKLVILWSPNYLDRLWCVYELAVFLRTHGKEDVILVNLDHFKLCVSLMLLQFLSVPVLSLAEEHISGRIVYAGYALGAATSFLIGRRAFCSSDEWQGFCSKVKSFSVHRAKCSTLADRNTLRKLITDMYGSETKFAAVVRAIWLGEGEEKHYPAWLFSMATLRILCAPYVPLIVASTVHAIARRTRGVSVALIPVYRPGVIPEPLPGRVHTTLWDIRTSIVPLIMMSFRAPVMLIVVHKLTTSSTFRKFGKWCLSVTFSLTFAAYNCSTQLICGLQIFYHPLRMAPIARSVDEVLFWLGGIIAVGVVFSILRRSYASELLIDLSKPSH
ncbi:hypothetical protein FOZ61_003050 [Perkinsus olseni]|uniref:TIR domain-containing protein n=1 Tax=Perkinsus olseni TaxID=32597 RepID=A0A7J6LQS6_PEROL|nr:hypothetical protein FOZ61_003050 [Perkinsus olseni]KAF4667135.1 hypothetical protein FOL46_002672 [Perkinsus olseni]